MIKTMQTKKLLLVYAAIITWLIIIGSTPNRTDNTKVVHDAVISCIPVKDKGKENIEILKKVSTGEIKINKYQKEKLTEFYLTRK